MQGIPPLLLNRWTDGPSRLKDSTLLFYRWTDGVGIIKSLCFTDGPMNGYNYYVLPMDRWMGIIIMFYRLSEGLIFHVIRSTDGHLGVSSGRATDWPYCTQAPPASSDVKGAKRFLPDRDAD